MDGYTKFKLSRIYDALVRIYGCETVPYEKVVSRATDEDVNIFYAEMLKRGIIKI